MRETMADDVAAQPPLGEVHMTLCAGQVELALARVELRLAAIVISCGCAVHAHLPRHAARLIGEIGRHR
jgi:hypothetical protein